MKITIHTTTNLSAVMLLDTESEASNMLESLVWEMRNSGRTEDEALTIVAQQVRVWLRARVLGRVTELSS